jgi:hypothetical protein
MSMGLEHAALGMRSRFGRRGLRAAIAVFAGIVFTALAGIALADEVHSLPDSGNLVDFRGQDGAVGVFRVTGSTEGRIYGTDVYTDDSDVGTAAVHAGVVSPGEVKNLRIEIVAGKTSYRGSARHGIVSESYGQWVGSYEFLDKPEPARPGSVLPDPGNLEAFRDQVGQTLRFDVVGSTDGSVYGDGTYTDDSKLSTAAVHAGLLAPEQEGVVAVTIMPGQSHYVAARRHNIDSRDFGAWQGSFSFAGAQQTPADNGPGDQILPDPGTMTDYRGDNGQVFKFRVIGNANGSVFGDGVYTDDTRIATAAVHAGVLRDGQEGVVAVEVLPGQDSYRAATRNGVTSADYGAWAGSYEFVTAN